MAKYLFLYHGGSNAESEEEQAKVMQAWGVWFSTLGGSIVDGGNPTGESSTVAADGSASAGGGANPASGYSLIDADDMEDALRKARSCPVLQSGGSVEVCATIHIDM